jgi:hypothetical protein
VLDDAQVGDGVSFVQRGQQAIGGGYAARAMRDDERRGNEAAVPIDRDEDELTIGAEEIRLPHAAREQASVRASQHGRINTESLYESATDKLS